MMDYDKLIERLRTESLYADKASLEIMDLCMEAAEAISRLRAEAEGMRANWYKSIAKITRTRNEMQRR